MLKLATFKGEKGERGQPPSGGCVLKLATFKGEKGERGQPPSGGCVLKQTGLPWILAVGAAAFGRLCVET